MAQTLEFPLSPHSMLDSALNATLLTTGLIIVMEAPHGVEGVSGCAAR
jgi:hypothetical protein